jgi:hypothetical protein
LLNPSARGATFMAGVPAGGPLAVPTNLARLPRLLAYAPGAGPEGLVGRPKRGIPMLVLVWRGTGGRTTTLRDYTPSAGLPRCEFRGDQLTGRLKPGMDDSPLLSGSGLTELP